MVVSDRREEPERGSVRAADCYIRGTALACAMGLSGNCVEVASFSGSPGRFYMILTSRGN